MALGRKSVVALSTFDSRTESYMRVASEGYRDYWVHVLQCTQGPGNPSAEVVRGGLKMMSSGV